LRQEAGVVTVPDLHLDGKCDVAQGYINTMVEPVKVFFGRKRTFAKRGCMLG
jgi:hypothetical protein